MIKVITLVKYKIRRKTYVHLKSKLISDFAVSNINAYQKFQGSPSKVKGEFITNFSSFCIEFSIRRYEEIFILSQEFISIVKRELYQSQV
jgi:hypothetical protein